MHPSPGSAFRRSRRGPKLPGPRRRPGAAVATVALLALAGLLTSCGEAPNHHAGVRPAKAAVTPISGAPAASELDAAMLGSGDIQSTWSLVAPTETLSLAPPGCRSGLGSTLSPVASATREWQDTQGPLPVLTEILASFPTGQASGQYQGLIQAADSCTNASLHVGQATVEAHVSHSGPLGLGVPNQAYAATLTAPGHSLHLGLDVFQDGAVVGAVAYTTPSSQTSATLDHYASRAVAKLETLS